MSKDNWKITSALLWYAAKYSTGFFIGWFSGDLRKAGYTVSSFLLIVSSVLLLTAYLVSQHIENME